MAGALLVGASKASAGVWSDAEGIAAQANALQDRAVELAAANTDAYAAALDALHGEHTGTSERDQMIGERLARAAELPLQVAETAADVAALGAVVARQAAPSVQQDAAAAVLMADAATQATVRLVGVNLTTRQGDPRLEAARRAGSAARAAVASLDV